MGDVIGDLNSKRARVLGMEPIGGGRTRIAAHAPLAEMTHYATALRSITQGRGSFTMTLLDYEQVPPHEAQKIIEANKMAEPVLALSILRTCSRAQVAGAATRLLLV
jgi:elongation factor G